MIITKTKIEDLKEVMEIVEDSRLFLKNNGVDQWQNGYPETSDFKEDIEKGQSYIVKDKEEIVGVFAKIGHDPNYDYIEEGQWLDYSDYVAIHRVAVKYKNKGICGFIFEEMKKLHNHIRVDTHKDNKPMNACIKRHGFIYCGTVYMEDHSPRNAYEYTKGANVFKGSTPLFYKVTDDKGHELYMLGTIHVGSASMYPLPKTIMEAFNEADSLGLEVDLYNDEEIVKMKGEQPQNKEISNEDFEKFIKAFLEQVALDKDNGLSEKLGEDKYNKILEMCELDSKEVMNKKIKPSYLFALVQKAIMKKANIDSKYGIDLKLAEMAKKQNKEIFGFEKYKDQEELLEMSDDYIAEQLKEVLDEKDESLKSLKDLVKAWCEGDDKALKKMLNDGDNKKSDNESINQEKALIKQKLDTERNKKFVEDVEKLLKEGKKAFVAIGTAHLINDDGLVNELRKKGYKVEQLSPKS